MDRSQHPKRSDPSDRIGYAIGYTFGVALVALTVMSVIKLGLVWFG